MGLFDAFQRKTCDICGNKVGLLGGTKLADGRLCKECAGKLSPWLSGLRNLTLEDIKRHLAYREANAEVVKNFNITHIVGKGKTKLYLNLPERKFIVTGNENWRNYNPDVLSFDQIVDADFNIDERKTELKTKDENGKQISYNPPRYEYSYNFETTLKVNSEWFNALEFKMNGSSIDEIDSEDYDKAYLACEEFVEVITALRDGNDEDITETIDYYKRLADRPKRSYDENTYYSDSRKLKRGRDYYVERDPRKNYYRKY